MGKEADCMELMDVVMQETHRPRRADPVGPRESRSEVRKEELLS